jgi:hypothetical protein
MQDCTCYIFLFEDIAKFIRNARNMLGYKRCGKNKHVTIIKKKAESSKNMRSSTVMKGTVKEEMTASDIQECILEIGYVKQKKSIGTLQSSLSILVICRKQTWKCTKANISRLVKLRYN